MTVVPMPRKEQEALAVEANALVRSASAITITDTASYADALEFGSVVKSLQKKITDFFAPHKKRAHEAWRGLCDEETQQLEPTKRAESIVKAKAIEWQRTERRRIAEEERVRQEAARRQAEERALAEAIAAEAEGDDATAAAILDEPIVAPVPVTPLRAVPKVAEAATTKRWALNEEATNLEALVRFIAGVPAASPLARPDLISLLSLNTKAARQMITAHRDRFNVPGVVAYEDEGISLRGK